MQSAPCEQDIELLMMLNPGMTRDEALRGMARAAVHDDLLRRRAAAGDQQAIKQFRTEQRELARVLAHAEAKVEAQLVMVRGYA